MIGFHSIDNRLQKICRQSLEFIQYDYGINYVNVSSMNFNKI